jgi:hypothetical protein
MSEILGDSLGILAFYVLFLLLLWGKLRLAPRPVSAWLRRLHTFIFLGMSGFVLLIFLQFWMMYLLHLPIGVRSPYSVILFYSILGVATLWFVFCGFWVRGLFRPNGRLSEDHLLHPQNIWQKLACRQFENQTDAAGPSDDTASDLQDLSLLK